MSHASSDRIRLFTIDGDESEGAVHGVGPLISEEHLQVGNICELVQVASDTDLVALSRRNEPYCVV